MSELKTASEIAKEAARLVSGDRNATHGDILQNHAIIACMWNGYLKARGAAFKSANLDAEDVANLMECLKIARSLSGTFNIDDYVDRCGYGAVAGEIRTRMERSNIGVRGDA